MVAPPSGFTYRNSLQNTRTQTAQVHYIRPQSMGRPMPISFMEEVGLFLGDKLSEDKNAEHAQTITLQKGGHIGLP